MPPTILYDVVIEGDFTPERIDWGNDAGWVERVRDKIDSALRLTLHPKPDAPFSLPRVTVELGGRRRWVLFSRIIHSISPRGSMRCYCLGWQSTIRGRNVKSLMWVYPNGLVELAEEPTIYKEFMGDQVRMINERADGGAGG